MKPRILIAEDEELVAGFLNSCLDRAGYEVIGTHETGEEAVRHARALKPDLALLDIELRGGMDGVAAAHEMRKSDIPVVFLTADASEGTVSRATAAAPYGYLVKPFECRELVATMAAAIQRSSVNLDLARRGNWFEFVMGLIDDAVVLTSADGSILYLSPAAEALCGCTALEVLGAPFGRVFPDAASEARDLISRAANAANGEVVGRTAIAGPGGRPIDMHLHASPVDPRDGKASAVVVVLRQGAR